MTGVARRAALHPGTRSRPRARSRRPRARIAALALWAQLFLLHAALAMPARFHIDSWTTDNHLPQNVILDMCQAPDGYLWMATLDGLVRFDGVRFLVFNRSNTPGIEGNRFTSLYCMPDGDLWAGTESSGITHYSRGRFETYSAGHGVPADEVPAVIGDGRGHVWALSQTSIVRWNGVDFVMLTLPPEESQCSYFPMGRSGFWCIRDGSLHVFDRGRFLVYPLPPGWPRSSPVRAGQDLSGVIWLADGNGRFASLSGGRWVNIPATVQERGGTPRWAGRQSVYRDRGGNPWTISVGTDSGAFLLQAVNLGQGDQLRRIVFNAFFEDREGSVWLATDGQGLFRLRPEIVTTLSREEGLPDRNTYPVFQDREGTIWIGTWNGGLARFRDGRLTAVPIGDVPTAKRVNSIFEDRSGALWVATSMELYRMEGGRFHPVSVPGGTPSIRAMYQDSDDTLRFATDRGLLSLKGGAWSLLTPRDGLATGDLRVIIGGRAGNLWIGGYGGLSSLDHGRLQHWTEADGLPSDSIRSLYEDPEGVLWIGTYDGGLGRLEQGRFTRYTTREGLFSNGVFQILEDARGYLWMSSNRGIYSVSKRELKEIAMGRREAVYPAVYGKSEGMRNAECNGGLWPAGIRARDGRFWFPTQDGVAIVDPGAVTTNPVAPPVVIESVLLDSRPQELDRPVLIPPGGENLEIEYTALSFLNSEQIPFRYRLEGLDRDWVNADARRTAYYSHLPPGRYTFRVIAANSDGIWNLSGKSLEIIVPPPYYRTGWFRALAAACSLGAAALLWRSRVSKLERAGALQSSFTRQLIASQEGERKRIAAELHDGLGQQLVVIRHQALIPLMNGASRTAMRIRLEKISEEALQALGEVKRISYNLRPYQLDRLGLTKAIEGIVKQAADSTAIRFASEIDSIDDIFDKDAEINFYRIAQECVNNLVRHAQATTARVTVRRLPDDLTLTIWDDGRGFAVEAPQVNGEAGGFGLIGISERAHLLGGRLAIHSEPGQGTRITVRIPLGGVADRDSLRGDG